MNTTKIGTKPEKTCKNLGLRKIATLCLNALWGTFGQNADKNDYDFRFTHESLVKQLINNRKILCTQISGLSIPTTAINLPASQNFIYIDAASTRNAQKTWRFQF
jgi:hypothetical protein